MNALRGLVLAGGTSRRMGSAKQSLRLGGRTLAERAAGLLAPVCDRVFVSVAGADSPSGGTGRRATPPPGELLPDRFPGRGPLGALATAFAADPDADWFVLPCDLPFLSPGSVRTLAGRRDPVAEVVLFRLPGAVRPHYLAGIWKSAARFAVQEALAGGRLAVRDTVARLRVRTHPVEDPGELLDVNTPEAWRRAVERFRAAGK